MLQLSIRHSFMFTNESKISNSKKHENLQTADMYIDHHGLRWGRKTYSIICPQPNLPTFSCLSTMTCKTNPHEEHMKYVLQVVQLEPTLYQGLLHYKRWNYCKRPTQESSVDMSFWVMTFKTNFNLSLFFPWPLVWSLIKYCSKVN